MVRLRLAAIAAALLAALILPAPAAAADAPGTCASATGASPQGSWLYEQISSSTDVDWYRFVVANDRYVLITLGRLPRDYDLYLYAASSCTSSIASSHRSNTEHDEIYRKLAAGTYFVKVVGYQGASSTSSYALRFHGLLEGMQVLSYTAYVDGAGYLHLPGEVLNNTDARRRSVAVEAVMHNATHNVLGRAVGYADRWIVPARSRSSFEIVTRRPSGYSHSHLTVSSLLTSSTPFPSLSVSAGTPTTDSAGVRHYPGRIANGSASTAHLAQAIATTYDTYGQVQRVGWGFAAPSSIGAGSSAPFDARIPDPVAANRVVYRAQASRVGCNTAPRYGGSTHENIVPPITRSTATGRVALTLDMGGRMDPALAIVRLLVANHVCASIFPTGAISKTSDGQAVLAAIRAHPELFELGNHTMHHCDLVVGGGGSPSSADATYCNGAKPSPSEAFVKKELTDGDLWIGTYSGMPTKRLWRAPYGAADADVLRWAAEAGWSKHVKWDIDTIDWRPIGDGGPTAYSMAHKVVDNGRSGSVVLMHLGGFETLDALPAMIDGLRSRGFITTTLSDMLR